MLDGIVATNDVHSSLSNAAGLLGELERLRATHLVVDSGDFFEGGGYYAMTGGLLDIEALDRLYDFVAPGNHGYLHYAATASLRRKTLCANVRDADGQLPFEPLAIRTVAGRRVAIVGVLSEQAFEAIPIGERGGQAVIPPVQALTALHQRHRHRADAWVVLSHSTARTDLHLAAACPFVDVVCSGHCHSDWYGPEVVGTTVVAKARETGGGYLRLAPADERWKVERRTFPEAVGPDQLSPDLADLIDRIGACAAQLERPVGVLRRSFADRRADPRELVSLVADGLLARVPIIDSVVLNESCVRPVGMGRLLTQAGLLQLAPFGTRFSSVRMSRDAASRLPARLARTVGPVHLTALPESDEVTVATTDYALANALDVGATPCGIALTDLLRDVLCEEGT